VVLLMKREDCIIGALVYTEDGPLYRYMVVAPPDENGQVEVDPTDDSWGSMDSFHLDELTLYNEAELMAVAAEMQAKVDEAKTAFEVAFQALRKVRDTHDKHGNYISKYDMKQMGLLSFDELEQTVERGGWSSSSLWC